MSLRDVTSFVTEPLFVAFLAFVAIVVFLIVCPKEKPSRKMIRCSDDDFDLGINDMDDWKKYDAEDHWARNENVCTPSESNSPHY